MITIQLTSSEAETIINGLRGWVHHQGAEDPQETPVQDYDPWPSDMSAVAGKIELACREASGA